MPTRYPDSKNVASFGDLRRHYDELKKELEQTQSTVKAERWSAKAAARGKRETQAELKKSVGRTARLQKQVSAQERAKEDSNRAAAWSASAATAVTIFYEICRATGQWPGGYAWQAVWEHPAVNGACICLLTFLFSQCYASAQKV